MQSRRGSAEVVGPGSTATEVQDRDRPALVHVPDASPPQRDRVVKLAFALPNLVQLKAVSQPWEAAVTGADQTRLARLADDLGYDMVAVPEHHVVPRSHVDLSGAHYFHAYSAMAYLAGATERIRVNSCVAVLPLQHPVVQAKALATIDWMSSGRLTVTFGVGWLKEEFDLLGVPFHRRGAMAEEYVQAILALWTQEEPAFEGEFVSFHDVAFEPKPVQRPHPRVWFGGDADAVLKRVARYGSGWWPFLTPPDQIPAKLDVIRSQPEYDGGLSEVFYGMGTGRVGEGHAVQDDPDGRPDMSREEIVDRLGRLAELGVTTSSVPLPAVADVQAYEDHVRWVAEEVMPAVAPL